jgi:hypothetical protein
LRPGRIVLWWFRRSSRTAATGRQSGSSNTLASLSATATRAWPICRARRFFAWCERECIGQLVDIEPLHVGAYIEMLGDSFEKPTVKQHLAAIRKLFDWLVLGQIVATNPAHAVRGPTHVVKSGKTTVVRYTYREMLADVTRGDFAGFFHHPAAGDRLLRVRLTEFAFCLNQCASDGRFRLK